MILTNQNGPLNAGLVAIALLSGGFYASTASAQNIGSQGRAASLFARDRAVSVVSRQRPDYQALGLRAGAFTVYPKAQTELESNDNVLATSANEKSDVIFRVRPAVSMESNWPRHFLTAYANGNVSRNADLESEKIDELTLGGRGRLDISREANIVIGSDAAHLVEPRTSTNIPLAAAKPIQFDDAQAYITGVVTRNRLRFTGRADVRQFDYEDGRTVDGLLIEQDDRDRTAVTMLGRVDYAISPATAVFVQATGNQREYDHVSTVAAERDSQGVEVLTGVNFEIGAVSRGELAVGYITQEYDNALFGDIDGFGARAQVEWFPTELTTVTATAARTVEDSGIIGSAGYLRSEATARVDHELLRNMLLNARFNYSKDEYNGVDRGDKRFVLSAGATYLVNRRLGVSGSVIYLDQQSEGASRGPNYNVTRFVLSVVTQF